MRLWNKVGELKSFFGFWVCFCSHFWGSVETEALSWLWYCSLIFSFLFSLLLFLYVFMGMLFDEVI